MGKNETFKTAQKEFEDWWADNRDYVDGKSGKYPAFEEHLGADKAEEKYRNKINHPSKIKGAVINIIVAAIIIAPALFGIFFIGSSIFNSNTNNEATSNASPAPETTSSSAETTPEPTSTPTPSTTPETPVADGESPTRKLCLTTPTATPVKESDGSLTYTKGTGRESYYVSANEDCGVRYTGQKPSFKEEFNEIMAKVKTGAAIAFPIILFIVTAIYTVRNLILET